MTTIGWIHLASIFYLSFVVAFVFSINSEVRAGRVLRETLRRMAKLLGGLGVIALLVAGLSLLS